MPGTNTLAYWLLSWATNKRKYCECGFCGLNYKPMTIVNDDARVINKLEASLTDDAIVIIYKRHMFIVQATGQWCFAGRWEFFVQKVVIVKSNLLFYFCIIFIFGQSLAWRPFSKEFLLFYSNSHETDLSQVLQTFLWP